MTATQNTYRVRITWMDRQGNAACLGLDETVTVEASSPAAAVHAAETEATYHGECHGVDTSRYHPAAEVLEE